MVSRIAPDFEHCDMKPPPGYPRAEGKPVCISGKLCRDPEHEEPPGGYVALGDPRRGWPDWPTSRRPDIRVIRDPARAPE